MIRNIIQLIYNKIIFRQKENDIFISIFAKVNNKSILEGQNKINTHTIFNGELGFGSYIANNCELFDVKIGRYSSIGPNVKIISATHPTNTFVSTSPCFYSQFKQNGVSYVKKQKYNEYIYVKNTHYSAIIGNDVWIGADVTIIGGITIGDGAIIATGAVVTKDIQPYSIVGGVPARLIRMRFTDKQIHYLLNLKWWNKSLEWIKSHAELFDNIDNFIDNTNK